MKSIRGLVLYREDLKDEFKESPFYVVEWKHFVHSTTGVVLSDDIVVFVDADGQSKLIKNRFGSV